MPDVIRRTLLLAAAAPLAAAAQDFPARTVSLTVPSPPGGTTDFTARLVAEPLAVRLGVPVVVENRPGGNGLIGMRAAAAARADGHALLVGYSGGITGLPAIGATAGFDPARELTPVALLTEAPQLMMVHPDVPARTLAEFIALARARPGTLAYASSGNGSLQHLGTELLKHRTGIDLLHISYRGTGETIADLLAGRVQFYLSTTPPVAGYLRDGRLRALAIAAPARHPSFPEVPTVAEAGLPDYAADAWFGLFAPAGTPAPVVARLTAACAAVLAEPAVASRAMEAGAFARFEDPATLRARMRREVAAWSALAQAAGIRAD